MKKLVLLFVAAISFISCSDEIKFNNPSIDAYVDEDHFRATRPVALINNNGTVTIKGESIYGLMSFTLESAAPGTYYFGLPDASNVANYTLYTESINFRYSTQMGPANPEIEQDLGYLTIYGPEDEKASKDGTLSGEFSFRARIVEANGFVKPNVFVHKGHFYGAKIVD